jgi:hypothetical protein
MMISGHTRTLRNEDPPRRLSRSIGVSASPYNVTTCLLDLTSYGPLVVSGFSINGPESTGRSCWSGPKLRRIGRPEYA